MKHCPYSHVSYGDHSNYVSIKTPKGKWICVDVCMVLELKQLWDAGIETLECCCGHGGKRGYGYVAVTEASREKIEALGYLPDPAAEHCYLAKTHTLDSRDTLLEQAAKALEDVKGLVTAIILDVRLSERYALSQSMVDLEKAFDSVLPAIKNHLGEKSHEI